MLPTRCCLKSVICRRPISLLYKIETRTFSNSTVVEDEMHYKPKSTLKEYKKLCTWKHLGELVDNLEKNIVYYQPETDKTGLVVVNKPYGLAARAAQDSEFCFEAALAGLSNRLNIDSLHLIKSTDRFCSGLTLLGSEHTKKAVKKCFGRSLCNQTLPFSFLSIVKGEPSINKVETVDRLLVDCPEVNKPLFGSMHKEPVLSRKKSKKNRLDGSKRVHVSIRSISRGPRGAGIVEVCPSSFGKHFIPVYLADVGHPMIGDQLYDYRARTLMGHKVKLSTAHTQAKRCQVLPEHLLNTLGLSKGDEWKLPRMLHLHRIHFPDWLGKGKDLTVYGPPPSYWLTTVNALEIPWNYTNVAKEDKVKCWSQKTKSSSGVESDSDLSKFVIELK